MSLWTKDGLKVYDIDPLHLVYFRVRVTAPSCSFHSLSNISSLGPVLLFPISSTFYFLLCSWPFYSTYLINIFFILITILFRKTLPLPPPLSYWAFPEVRWPSSPVCYSSFIPSTPKLLPMSKVVTKYSLSFF